MKNKIKNLDDMNFPKLKEERIPKVVHHRLACGGEARLAGSRVCSLRSAVTAWTAVWNIIWNLNNGHTEKELLEDSPRLTIADIKAAKKYYRENKQEIDYDICNHSQRKPVIEKLQKKNYWEGSNAKLETWTKANNEVITSSPGFYPG